MLRYDHVEEYKNSFLQFGQNNAIKTHFTDEKMCSQRGKPCLVGEVWYLLSNASLEYASHLLNRLSTTLIGDKTLLEI